MIIASIRLPPPPLSRGHTESICGACCFDFHNRCLIFACNFDGQWNTSTGYKVDIKVCSNCWIKNRNSIYSKGPMWKLLLYIELGSEHVMVFVYFELVSWSSTKLSTASKREKKRFLVILLQLASWTSRVSSRNSLARTANQNLCWPRWQNRIVKG